MQVKWLRRGESNRLKIFVLGWAADESMISLKEVDCDVMCVYDYRKIETLIMPDGYTELLLVAWSYGVWAAERIFEGCNFKQAVAVNGTPMPMDDFYGIPKRLFDLTIKGVEKNGLEKFAQRMFNGHESMVKINRKAEECVEELKALANYFDMGYRPVINWSKAIVGGRDLIFAPESQMRYWNEAGVEVEYVEQMPHFPFGVF